MLEEIAEAVKLAARIDDNAREELRVPDPIAVERAEKSLDEFINSRSKAKDNANAEADLWRISERKHREKRQEELCLAWYCYHLDTAERLRRSMTALVEKHEAAATSLLEELPKGET